MQTSLVQKLAAYKPSQEGIDLVKQTKMLLLVGISGAGKDTMKVQLLKHGGYHHIISHTTRSPRYNHGLLEQDGVDYHFISLEEAEKMLDEQAFIEAKSYSDNIYGTSLREIRIAHDSGAIAVTAIEVQGVAEYKALSDDVRAVFLLPPSFDVWQRRLAQRYEGTTLDEEDIAKRMNTAKEELAHALETDYFHFVINDELSKTFDTINRLAHHEPVDNTDDETRALAQKIARELENHN
jgi:guanylate kinase